MEEGLEGLETGGSYCQAANCSSAALSLQHRLGEESEMAVETNPIVAFNSVGTDLRVWLTFLAREGDDLLGHVRIPLAIIVYKRC